MSRVSRRDASSRGGTAANRGTATPRARLNWRRLFCMGGVYRRVKRIRQKAEGRRQKCYASTLLKRSRGSTSAFCLLPSAFCQYLHSSDKLNLHASRKTLPDPPATCGVCRLHEVSEASVSGVRDAMGRHLPLLPV